MEARRGASCGTRASKRLHAETPWSTGFPARSDRILAKCDLPEPKYPEIQTPISVVF